MDKHSKRSASIFRYPVLIAFTLFFAGLFLLDLVTPDRAYSELENTTLSQRPSLFSVSADGLNKFFTAYTKYVKDQVVGRDNWVALQSTVETKVMQKEQSGGILLGTGIAVGRHPIPGHKGIEAHGRKDQGYGLRLPGGKVPVSAAGADDHRRALNIGINLRVNLRAVYIQGQGKTIGGGHRYALVQHGAGRPPSKNECSAIIARFSPWVNMRKRPSRPARLLPGDKHAILTAWSKSHNIS